MTNDNARVTERDHPVQSQYTTQQTQQLLDFQALARQAQFQTFNTSSPHSLMFFVGFDGTGNDRGDLTRPETNVSRLETAVSAELSSTQGGLSVYRRGPGTQSEWLTGRLDTASGFTVAETAREVYHEYADYVRANPGKEVTVSGIGFSRGAATLSAFTNMVYNEGVPDLSSERIVGFVNGKDVVTYDRYVVPPGDAKLGLMIMLDRVATGAARTPEHQQLPPSKDLRVLSVQALDEHDSFFQLDSFRDRQTGELDPRVTEVWIPGAHSDIGGGYVGNGVALRVLEGLMEFVAGSGQPVGVLREQDSHEGKPLLIHNSYGGRRGMDDPAYGGPEYGGWVTESRDQNSVRYKTPPHVTDEQREVLDDGSSRVLRTYSDGTREAVTRDFNGAAHSYEQTTIGANGVATTLRLDANKQWVSTTTVQSFEDPEGESRVETTTFRDGSKRTQVFDAEGTLITDSYRGRETGGELAIPVDPSAEGMKPVSISNVVIDGRTYIQDINGDYAIDLGQGQREVYDPRVGKIYLESDGQRTEVGTNQRVALSDTGLAAIVPAVASSLAAFQLTDQQVAVISDVTSFINAIRSGQDLPIAASGIKLLNDLPSLVGDKAPPLIGTANTIAQGVLSAYNLANAFGGGANDLTKVSSTLSTVNYVNLTLFEGARAASTTLAGQVNTFLNGSPLGAAGGSIGVLPALGLVASIKTGDPIGAAMSVGTLIQGSAFFTTNPLGWALLAASFVKAMEEPPEAWGIGTFTFSAGGTTLVLDAQGESFGIDRVRQLMQGNGESPTLPDGSANPNFFGGMQGYLQQMVDASTLADPTRPLGIVPQRLPTLTWREARQPEPGYAVRDIDPLTGEERYPGLRYNDDWTPYNADATDPEQRRNIFERMVVSALERGAIAPLWEVRTAKLQQDAGDPLAGLTEEERAARRGLLAPIDPNTQQHAAGQFRPAALDLDGDGRITTIANADTDRAFNWDGSGFDKQVGWVGSGDGLLWLDRNPNGLADSGKELFSNSLLSDAAKGVRSLAAVDANGDGLINAADPVFGELNVWQDADGDATVDAGEAQSLADLGITGLDYANNRYTRNGQFQSLQTVVLEADGAGQRVSVVPEGIRVEFSDGRATVFVTKVNDLGAGNDGIDAVEDGGVDRDAQGQPIGQAPTRHDPLSIATALLLANDQVNGSNAGLAITAVGNASVGSVSLNTQTGAVEFFAPHHFNGTATFDYTVTAPNGQSKTATVTMNVAPVNDRPDVQAVLPDRAIYGWGPLVQRRLVGGGEGGTSEEITITAHKGEPFYAPYLTVAGRRLVEEVSGGGEGGPISMWVETGPVLDTTIPKSYFDSEWAKVQAGQWSAENPAPTYLEFQWAGERYRVQGAPGAYLHDTPVASEPGNDGLLTVTDVDGGGGAGYRYEIHSQPLYGRLGGDGSADDIDPSTGAFTYEGRRYVERDEAGNLVMQNVYTDKHARGEWDGDPSKAANWDSFTVKVLDLSDPSGNTFTLKDVKVPHFGPQPSPDVQSGGKKPIAIDLNGDGFHFTDVDDSNVFFDVNGDGWRRRMAWNNPQDGFIAFDKDGDGKISGFDELSFVPHDASGRTDLEALRGAFDTNGDGVFSAQDEQWNAFGVWRDADADGITDEGEFRSLAQMGISRIALTSDGQFQVIDGQTVHGTALATKTDGSTLAIADVTLRYRNETQIVTPGGGTTTAPVPSFQPGSVFDGTPGADLVLGTAGSDMFRTGAGNDVINDDSGNDGVQAGAGDDLVYTGSDNDIVDAGAGNDAVFAGVGNDIAFGDDGDDMLMLEGGNDVAFGGAGQDFIGGGDGNDALSGDAGDDKLFGEGGWDALFGKAGDDELWGMDGNDLLYGDEGADLLVGGTGDDQMEGGLGDDAYEVDAAGDQAIERAGEGRDNVRASIAYTLGDTLEDLTLTGAAAINGTGNAGSNLLVGNEAANRLEGLAGDDTLDGALGADVLVGGTGDDTYVVDDAGDVVVEAAGEGTDTVRSRITTLLATNVENLTLVGLGAIDAIGNGDDNLLVGNAAANTLDGRAGDDVMRGGRGNDRYVVEGDAGSAKTDDRIVELKGEGYDTAVVRGPVRFVLSDHVEAAELEGALAHAVGNGLDNVMRTQGSRQTIEGMDGADTLIVSGDEHVVIGGRGDDQISVSGNRNAISVDDDAWSPNATWPNPASASSAGDNTVVVHGNDNRIAGGYGNDTIELFGEGNQLADVDGDNTIRIDGAFNHVRGGAGRDTIDVTGSGNTVSGGTGDNVVVGHGDGHWLMGGSDFYAEPGSATVTAWGDGNRLFGTQGDDTLTVHGNGNVLYQNVGNDTFDLYGDGNDVESHWGEDLAYGNRTFNVIGNGNSIGASDVGPQHIDGVNHVTARIQGNGNGLWGSIRDGGTIDARAEGDGNILESGAHETADTLAVSGNDNQMRGGGGGDTLAASGQRNVVHGDFGDDFISLAGDRNSVYGGEDDDAITVEGSDNVVEVDEDLSFIENPALWAGDNTVTATGDRNLVRGGFGRDVLAATGDGNRLEGGDGDDVLRATGTGNILIGGTGDDDYAVDDAGAIIVEEAFGGFDRVDASIDYVLPEHVEQLTLTGTAVRGTGNDLDNLLFGNGLDNVLDGAVGTDQMHGGAGDDRYVVDQAGDAVVEQTAGGIDTVVASVDAALSANVEHLVLVGAALAGTGNAGANALVGNAGANVLAAGDGNDVLAGGRGDDAVDGGLGDDLYLYHQGEGRDVLVDAAGTDTLRFGAGITIDSLAARPVVVGGQNKVFISVLGSDGNEQADQGIELLASGAIERFEFAEGSTATLADLTIGTRTVNAGSANDMLIGDRSDDVINAGTGNDTVYGRWGHDTLAGGVGTDKLFGEGGHDRLQGGSEADELWGGAGNDVLDGGSGADLLMGGTGSDRLFGGTEADRLDGGDGDDTIDGSSGEDELYGAAGHDTLDGGSDADLLAGGAGNDVLRAGTGLDVVVAGAGDDRIDTDTDADFIDAGDGADVIGTGTGADFIAGGRGNDVIDAGQDRDLIAFNRGDGADTVVTSSWQRDTLSLGGGVRYADLALRKDGNHLVLGVGQGDSITFADWYLDASRRNVTTLQVVTAASADYSAGSSDRMRNRKTVAFDFEALVNRFDQARAATPGLASWALAGQLNTHYLRGSDTEALGGDIAFRYATTGSYGDLDWRSVRTRMSALRRAAWEPLTASTTVDPWTALQAGISLVADATAGLPSPIAPVASPTDDELAFAALSASQRPAWMQQGQPVLPHA